MSTPSSDTTRTSSCSRARASHVPPGRAPIHGRRGAICEVSPDLYRNGWLDAEPEIGVIQPDMYAVNEDGDKPEKREYCEKNGIEYVVLKREPKAGLTRRQSTALRGF